MFLFIPISKRKDTYNILAYHILFPIFPLLGLNEILLLHVLLAICIVDNLVPLGSVS